MRRSSPRRELSSSPDDWRRQSSNIRVGGPPSPIFTKEEGSCGCTSGLFSMFFWGSSRATSSQTPPEEEVRSSSSSFSSVFSGYSTMCGGEQGMTYEQAVSRPPARDINYWYDSVAAMNDEDDEEECPLIVPPSFINAYDFEQVDEDVAVLENAVQQLKLEVEKLEKKKKKKSKKQDDNKENLLTSSTVAGQSPTTKDRELASSQQTEVEPSAML